MGDRRRARGAALASPPRDARTVEPVQRPTACLTTILRCGASHRGRARGVWGDRVGRVQQSTRQGTWCPWRRPPTALWPWNGRRPHRVDHAEQDVGRLKLLSLRCVRSVDAFVDGVDATAGAGPPWSAWPVPGPPARPASWCSPDCCDSPYGSVTTGCGVAYGGGSRPDHRVPAGGDHLGGGTGERALLPGRRRAQAGSDLLAHLRCGQARPGQVTTQQAGHVNTAGVQASRV